MTKTTVKAFSAGTYVPFRGLAKGIQPAGSWSMESNTLGDATGGFLNLQVTMRALEEGFHGILTLGFISAVDNLASISELIFQYGAVQSERLESVISVPKLGVANGSNNIATWIGEELMIPIEPNLEDASVIFTVQWQTNTDTKSYQITCWGFLWDMEVIARMTNGVMPPYFFGVR